jgi:hypothetical protein
MVFCHGAQVAIVKGQTPVAVIVKRGVHPEDRTAIFPCLPPFQEQEEGLLGFIFCFPADPDEKGHPTANDHEGFIQKIFSLRGAQVDAFTGIGACNENSVNVG